MEPMREPAVVRRGDGGVGPDARPRVVRGPGPAAWNVGGTLGRGDARRRVALTVTFDPDGGPMARPAGGRAPAGRGRPRKCTRGVQEGAGPGMPPLAWELELWRVPAAVPASSPSTGPATPRRIK